MQLKPIAAIIVLLLLVVVSLSIAGCTSHSSLSPSPTTSYPYGAASQTPTVTPSAVSLTVNSVTTTNKLAKFPFESSIAPGTNFVVVDVTLTNLNKYDFYMGSPTDFRLTTSDGMAYSMSNWGLLLLNNTIKLQDHTNPGDKVTGQLAFEIPQSAKATALTYSDVFNPPVTTDL